MMHGSLLEVTREELENDVFLPFDLKIYLLTLVV
jgi:hypothetical protein